MTQPVGDINRSEAKGEDVLDFALKSTALLVRNGSASVNATRSLLAMARVGGLDHASCSVTVDQISLSFIDPNTGVPVTRVQAVSGSGFNIRALAAAESTIERVVTETITFREGLEELRTAQSREQQVFPLTVLVGWLLLGGGFAWLLGAQPRACIIAALTTAAVESLGGRVGRTSLPSFYSHIVAGLIAVGATAVGSYALDLERPALIVVSAIVARLAGVASLGAAHDLLTGWYLTATARGLSALMDTTGLVTGVLIGLAVLNKLGWGLDLESQLTATLSVVPATVGASLVAAGFALSSGARWIHVPTVAGLGALASFVSTEMGLNGFSSLTAVTCASLMLGVLSVIIARPVNLPALAAMTTALVPLLPGTSIYAGFLAVGLKTGNAPKEFTLAAATAMAIGAGAVLGQYTLWLTMWRIKLAQFRRREQHVGEGELDPREFNAQALATPDFRRPFVQD